MHEPERFASVDRGVQNRNSDADAFYCAEKAEVDRMYERFRQVAQARFERWLLFGEKLAIPVPTEAP